MAYEIDFFLGYIEGYTSYTRSAYIVIKLWISRNKDLMM